MKLLSSTKWVFLYQVHIKSFQSLKAQVTWLQTDYEHFEAGAHSLMKYARETNDDGHFLSSVEFYRLQAHPPNSII